MSEGQPKKKMAKLMHGDTQQDSETSSTALVFGSVGVVSHILSFLLCRIPEMDRVEWCESTEIRHLKKNFGLRSVSKTFHDATWQIMSKHAPTQVISVAQLAKIKASVAVLDLKSLYEEFIKALFDKYPHGHEALDTIIDSFGPTRKQFAKLVSREYKKMLVVKAVEAVAAKKSDDSDAMAAVWKEKCQPTVLVDLMWHCHMLSPRMYSDDCTQIMGEILDHQASYVSPKQHAGSDYVSKRDTLFQYERQHFGERDFFGGRLGNDLGDGTARTMLFDNEFDIYHVAETTWADMQGFNDCG